MGQIVACKLAIRFLLKFRCIVLQQTTDESLLLAAKIKHHVARISIMYQDNLGFFFFSIKRKTFDIFACYVLVT
jgi:hypothetical protein